MSIRVQISTLAVCLALGTLTSTAALAQLAPPFNNYGAKFTCGVLTADADDVKGTYATAINIHNPQAKVSVPFTKKIVVANVEGQGFGKPIIKTDKLPPDAAEYVDCPLIYALTGIAPGTHIDGFVVLEIPPIVSSTAKLQPDLDVVGKYTSRGAAAGADSAVGLEIVTYSAKLITF